MNSDRQPTTWRLARGRLEIAVNAIPMGADLCLVVTGGTRPHLGAVAAAQSRPKSKGEGITASTSVITLYGHRDDAVAYRIASQIARRLNCNVAVCCGIHVDDITAEELVFVDEAAERFCREFPHPAA